MVIKATKRIFNSDKICRSYSDLNFGVTFFGTQCIWYSIPPVQQFFTIAGGGMSLELSIRLALSPVSSLTHATQGFTQGLRTQCNRKKIACAKSYAMQGPKLGLQEK